MPYMSEKCRLEDLLSFVERQIVFTIESTAKVKTPSLRVCNAKALSISIFNAPTSNKW